MKAFSTLVVLRAAPETLFRTMRDRMAEVAAALPDIEAIDELDRREGREGLIVVNRWRAATRVPGFLQAQLGTEIAWEDHAVWSATANACAWTIRPSIGDGAIACEGTTRFEPAMAGRGTRAQFSGELRIRPEFVARVAGPLAKPLTAFVEQIATTLIPANFRHAAEAAARL